MNPSPSVEHVQELLQLTRLAEARVELVAWLHSHPRDDRAWTIAAQLTSDHEQRKEFLRRVFDCSPNMNLADWAFRSLGQLADGPGDKLALPPVESLVVLSDSRVALNELVTQPTSPTPAPAQATSTPSASSAGAAGTDSPPSVSLPRRRRPRNWPIMIKTLGELIMIGAGVLFISTIYYDPLLQTFLEMGINPF